MITILDIALSIFVLVHRDILLGIVMLFVSMFLGAIIFFEDPCVVIEPDVEAMPDSPVADSPYIFLNSF